MLTALLVASLVSTVPQSSAAQSSAAQSSAAQSSAAQSQGVHTTYLWHLHQPIYWPDQRRDGVDDEYETAWESLQQKWGGAPNPENDLEEIFGKADRVAAYQWRVRDSISTMLWLPEAGAHVQYSGALTENVDGLGDAFQLGYSPSWNAPINEAENWLTSGGTPRASIVNFAHHHALLPLQSERTQWLQIRMHQERMAQVWGIAPGQAKGFFPPETSFSERLIPVLDDLGIEWTFVANEHLSRACPDFPVTLGSGGTMTDPPNRADQLNPVGVNWWGKFIDRGCSPTNAVPFAYQPHRAQYVDPDSGEVSEVIVVPTAQAISWDDGYGAIGSGALSGIAPFNDPARPMLVVLAHDGDNAWGGGYSYYQEAVPNFVSQAASAGYVPSTVDRYLQKYPVPAGDLVKVEDGSWVNADSDFGSPQFTNWLWYLLDADGNVDPLGGWHNKAREYAIFTAAENRLRTAEELSGGPSTTRIDHVLDPRFGTTAVERGWHYYLASMDSGNVYYGNPLDMEVKGTVGCNEAVEQVGPLLSSLTASGDAVEPTVFVPQRFPYNPGETNFGAPYGYQSFVNDGGFVVWTFAYDVSGIANATLRYRIDDDGQNPLGDHANELYAGGPGVGAWLDLPMSVRDFPSDNVYGWAGLEGYDLEQPAHIAQHLSAEVPPQLESLIDYYVEVTDLAGNVSRSAIQHVWVGDAEGQTGGGGPTSVEVAPDPLVRGESGVVRYESAGGPLSAAPAVWMHYGYDGWAAGTVQHAPMTATLDGAWEIAIDLPLDALTLDVAFNDTSNGQGGTWDNNGGADWHFDTVEASGPPSPILAPGGAIQSEVVVGRPGPTVPLELVSGDGQPHAFGVVAVEVGRERQGVKLAKVVGGLAPAGVGQGPTAPSTWATVSPVAGEVSEAGVTELSVTLDTASLAIGTHELVLVVADASGAPPLCVPILVDVVDPPPPVPEVTGIEPDPAQAGQSVRIWYVAAGGPLVGISQVWCHQGFDAWAAGTVLDRPMTEAVDDVWFVDVDVPTDVWELDFVFNDGGGQWDNNGGQDWIHPVEGGAPPPPPTVTTVEPNPPVAGQTVRIWYAAADGPLSGASSLVCHWGLDQWSAATIQDVPMTPADAGMWFADVVLPSSAFELDFVFNDGGGVWDNNGGQDWKFAIVP
ncbi:MAG: hypothetical protein ACYTFV_02730 [Planctomycetota bacterium]|jgi:hypothetical protein